MTVFKCKMCGGDLDVAEKQNIGTCQFCGSTMTLPRLDDDRRRNLYDRANHFRRNNEYDKARGIYETILNEDAEDAEAYWSLVLCKYGIEYVEDPQTHNRLPTCHRTQMTSIFADEDYKQAVAKADGASREIYEAEAQAIDEIQKGILSIVAAEKPYDVFICYKEQDDSGKRTRDSVLAQELYSELSELGFKIFFARITLEDMLGSAYEPHIFAALQSARIMVVLGTKPEYFNAVWVRNEWSRFLALIKDGAKKTLIPAYRDMDPYDLPDAFSHLQALDMAKLGFMQDLVRGIQKILRKDEPAAAPTVVVAPAAAAAGSAEALTKRGFLFLEEKKFDDANTYFERSLDADPEYAPAYTGKMLTKHKAESVDELIKKSSLPRLVKENRQEIEKYLANTNFNHDGAWNRKDPLGILNKAFVLRRSEEFARAERFADAKYAQELRKCREDENSSLYAGANEALAAANNLQNLVVAYHLFLGLDDYKEAKEKAAECKGKIQELDQATKARIKAQKEENRRLAEEKRLESAYAAALRQLNEATEMKETEDRLSPLKKAIGYQTAAKSFESISSYKGADSKGKECRRKSDEYRAAYFAKKKKIDLIQIAVAGAFVAALGIFFGIAIHSNPNPNASGGGIAFLFFLWGCSLIWVVYDSVHLEKPKYEGFDSSAYSFMYMLVFGWVFIWPVFLIYHVIRRDKITSGAAKVKEKYADNPPPMTLERLLDSKPDSTVGQDAA